MSVSQGKGVLAPNLTLTPVKQINLIQFRKRMTKCLYEFKKNINDGASRAASATMHRLHTYLYFTLQMEIFCSDKLFFLHLFCFLALLLEVLGRHTDIQK